MALKTKRVNPAFGQRLAELREAAALTQAALAERGGIPLGTIREIEQGRREPLFSNMQKLAAALNVSLDGWPAAALPEDPAPERTRGRPRNGPDGARHAGSPGKTGPGPSGDKIPAAKGGGRKAKGGMRPRRSRGPARHAPA